MAQKLDLIGGVKEWVLSNLPIEPNNSDTLKQLCNMDAHELLVTYHNWISRRIKPIPRCVKLSNRLQNNPCSIKYKTALGQIRNQIENGSDLTKYLSKNIRFITSTLGSPKKLNRRRDLDLMLNEWNMHHLHLSTNLGPDGYVERTKSLLIGIFTPETAYLLDIIEHGEWTKRSLLETLVREFPNSGCFNEIKDVVGLCHEPTEDEHRKLRSLGVNTAFMIDEKAILPMNSLSSAGTTIDATRYAVYVLLILEAFEKLWENSEMKIRSFFKSQYIELPNVVNRGGPTISTS